jgi:predicted glutamine amidotransferase
MRGIESRGRDSAGYAYVSRKGKKQTAVCKYPAPASKFLEIEGHLLSQKSITKMPRQMILHTRYATQGTPEENQNNHPIYAKESALCLVHNGWFIDDHVTMKQFALKKDAEVDTETYLRLIEKFYLQGETKTVEAGIQEATKNIWGSLACAMLQGGNPGTMWLWRDQGALELVETDWGYVFASTAKAITEALLASCMAIDLGWYEFMEVPYETLLVFKEDDKSIKGYKLEVPDWTTSPASVSNRVTRVWSNGKQSVRRTSRSGYAVPRYGKDYIYGGDYLDGTEEYYSAWDGHLEGRKAVDEARKNNGVITLDDKTKSSESTGPHESNLPGVPSGRTDSQNGSSQASADSSRQESKENEGFTSSHAKSCICRKCIDKAETEIVEETQHLVGCFCNLCIDYRFKKHFAEQTCGWRFCGTCHGGIPEGKELLLN